MSAVLAGTPLAACAHGPVLGESVSRLESDARALLDGTAERLSPPGTEPRLPSATTDTCPAGKARAVLHGALPLRSGVDPRLVLDHAAQLTLGLLRDRGYRLLRPPEGPRGRRGFAMISGIPVVEFTVRLNSRPAPVLLLEGTTPCLPR